MSLQHFWPKSLHPAMAALWLRLGLGAVFVIGGWSKLSQLLNPLHMQGIVDTYMGGKGYINVFFAQYLFEGPLGAVLTPWSFLTALSAFELISGIALIAGLLIRPLAIIYGLMLWSFVMALPVVVTPGVAVEVKTYTSPALLVQIRDVALSGLMFVLYNLGSGRYSLDERLFGDRALPNGVSWEHLGLLARLSLALPLLVGGFFVGLNSIQSFATQPLILVVLGLMLVSGLGVRAAGALVMAVMLWFMVSKLDMDKSLIANLNGFKREFAFLACGGVIAVLGGGKKFTLAVPGNLLRSWAAQRAPAQ